MIRFLKLWKQQDMRAEHLEQEIQTWEEEGGRLPLREVRSSRTVLSERTPLPPPIIVDQAARESLIEPVRFFQEFRKLGYSREEEYFFRLRISKRPAAH